MDSNMLHLADGVAEGLVPETLDEITELGQAVCRVNSRAGQTMAVLISAGRVKFDGRVVDWVNWCEDNFGLDQTCYRSHLAKIGDMLNALRQDGCNMLHYRAAYNLDLDKLLSIARIPQDRLSAFMSSNLNAQDRKSDVRQMTRSEVRNAVAAFLGEATTSVNTAEQPELPGLETVLDSFDRLDKSTLATVVTDPTTAHKTMLAGIGLLGASLEYQTSADNPDIMTLQSIKSALADEIQRIDAALAKSLR